MTKIRIYKTDTETNIKKLWNKSGTYEIFYKYQKKPLYIGYSGVNLYKTILRHFQSWTSGVKENQKTMSFKDKGFKKTNFFLTYELTTPKKAKVNEKKKIQTKKPKYNKQYNDVPF